ncbi:MAG TPA: hypothetical protein VK196_02865 [Magnetospirillum sp.]|nr:hypothetical protein [Magnetospirillum sp.]
MTGYLKAIVAVALLFPAASASAMDCKMLRTIVGAAGQDFENIKGPWESDWEGWVAKIVPPGSEKCRIADAESGGSSLSCQYLGLPTADAAIDKSDKLGRMVRACLSAQGDVEEKFLQGGVQEDNQYYMSKSHGTYVFDLDNGAVRIVVGSELHRSYDPKETIHSANFCVVTKPNLKRKPRCPT